MRLTEYAGKMLKHRGDRSKTQAGKDTAVQGTNDSSIVSKCSAAGLGYFEDNFLKCFVQKTVRRSPLINRGYYIRAKAMSHCQMKFLQATQGHPRRQILSLGAGFDTLYFRLKASGLLKDVMFFEVDFEDVVKRKAALIKADSRLQEILEDAELVPHDQNRELVIRGIDYRLVGIDLKELDKLGRVLIEAGISPEAPTLLISEVVLTYMENSKSDEVVAWAAKFFSSAVFVMYEQLQPSDPFGQVMQMHFQQLNSTLHALQLYPDKETQRMRFLHRGWEKCLCIDMNQFYYGLLCQDERNRVDQLEPFDEYEGWHLKCSHYFILTASKGQLRDCLLLSGFLGTSLSIAVPAFVPHSVPVSKLHMDPNVVGMVGSVDDNTALARFGLQCALLQPDCVLVTGGAGRHGREEGVHILFRAETDWRTGHAEVECIPGTEWGARMFHTVTPLPGCRTCVVFGGRSSPLQPACSVLRLTWNTLNPENCSFFKLNVHQLHCFGTLPPPRWRHTATLLTWKGKLYLFVFGGISVMHRVLSDWHFLELESNSWDKIPVRGPAPEGRHSHSACPYAGGLVIAGGAGREHNPLSSVVLLKPVQCGFEWQELKLEASFIARYSHTAHVFGDQLYLVGGIWIEAEGVPGVAVIDLTSGQCREYTVNACSVPWPVMMHSHSSLLLEEEKEILVIGGGGNCFSFGTYFNLLPLVLNLSDVR
ncbi:tRNA wybutosine-synthesizing protein 4 [Erpetoichthys calabaricus]|uniref:tRNA wybutosine-synthesizing protein 4 n=1 Tax=Erpetoichthys calabaricus TaxID=27687 RepID=A0A8C4S2P1_ERPCA|nr:tRNA wybutosine-synthesizing protein 4 [Erpetoichthys calabaricus]